MKKSKKTKKIVITCVSNFVLIMILLAVILLVPTVSVTIKTYYGALSDKFIGKKAEYQGIIKLWNVDTFEGGSASKSSFLMKTAESFEKLNKGAFIKVDNMTFAEMIAKLNNNELPHLISFGSGVGNYFEDLMLELDIDICSSHKVNLLGGGLKNTKLLAAAWAVSGYSLITTTAKLEDAKVEENPSLKDIVFSLAYDKKIGKKTKHIYSITFGGNEYSSAFNNFSRVFDNSSEVLASESILDQMYNTQTAYQAYCSFVENKASMLLGAGRDIHRMQNRLTAGKTADYLYQPLGEYTDLVQYISVLQSENAIENVCRDFIEYLVCSKVQQNLSNIGMLSVLKEVKLYANHYLRELEASITEDTLIKSAF